MAQAKITLDILYKSLKKHDADILKHFDDDNLNDFDYLFYALNSDIISNALNIVMNLKIGNEASIGIDNNARAIIEGFTILKMLGSGDISPEQLKIFRSHFAIVDYDNFKKYIKNSDHPMAEEMKKRNDDAFDFLISYFKCSKQKLRVMFVDDPLFYLKKDIRDKVNFATLLQKYPIFNEKTFNVYEFFSIMIHPRYLDSVKIEQGVQKMRQGYIYLVLDYVVKYMQNGKLFVLDDTMSNFDDDFTRNPLLFNNVNNIQQVFTAFDILFKELCQLKDGIDAFTTYLYRTLSHLIADMLLCESLGYNELTISKYKSFLEHASIYAEVNYAPDTYEEFKCLKWAYNYSALFQLDEHLKAIGMSDGDLNIDGLKEIYEKYYKPKYNIDSYETLVKGFRNNSLYFLDPTDQTKSYSKYVKKSLNEIFDNKGFVEELFETYKLSQDMNHASGYNFNSSPGIAEFHSHKVMHSVFVWLINQVLNGAMTVAEHDHEPHVEKVVEFFKEMAKFEEDAMVSVAKKYETDYLNFIKNLN